MPDISEFTSAIAAYPTLLYLGDGLSPETFTLVSEITNYTWPRAWSQEDVTAHGATDPVRRNLPTILDLSLQLEMNFLPVGHEVLETAFYAKSIDNYRLQIPSESPVGSPPVDYKLYSFPGRILTYEQTFPATGKLGATITLEMLAIPTQI